MLGPSVQRLASKLAAGSVATLLTVGGLGTTGCASPGPYVWINDVEVPAAGAQTFVIVPGDTLAINVYNEETVSGSTRVRSDGYITLMLVGEVLAAGKTPSALAVELQNALAKFLNQPTVAVRVETEEDINVAFIGEVASVGVVKLRRGSGLLWALTSAGGLSEYADGDAIYVIRQNPQIKIRFNYDDLVANDQHANAFPLRDGDVILVE